MSGKTLKNVPITGFVGDYVVVQSEHQQFYIPSGNFDLELLGRARLEIEERDRADKSKRAQSTQPAPAVDSASQEAALSPQLKRSGKVIPPQFAKAPLQSGMLSFEQIFPPAVQSTMGLGKLNQSEREALRSYVGGFISRSAAIPISAPAAPRANSRSPSLGYHYTGSNHWIKTNVDSGSYIILEDDSVWEIDPFDKIDASLWLPISDITVALSSKGSPGYDYILINTDDGEKAHAKPIKRN